MILLSILLLSILINTFLLNLLNPSWILLVCLSLFLSFQVMMLGYEAKNLLELKFVEDPMQYLNYSFGTLISNFL